MAGMAHVSASRRAQGAIGEPSAARSANDIGSVRSPVPVCADEELEV